MAGIVANLPLALFQVLELGRTGVLSALLIIGLLIGAVAVVAFIVFIERAQRRIVVQYPKRQVGNKMFGGEASHLPLKQIGRASCRERGCQYVERSVVAGQFKKNRNHNKTIDTRIKRYKQTKKN